MCVRCLVARFSSWWTVEVCIQTKQSRHDVETALMLYPEDTCGNYLLGQGIAGGDFLLSL